MNSNLINWQEICQTLGFDNEREMLENVYLMQGFSFKELAKIFGCSPHSVGRKLAELGIQPKRRGGPENRRGHRKLAKCNSDELFGEDIAKLTAKYNCHASTVTMERKLRRKEKSFALRTYSSGSVLT